MQLEELISYGVCPLRSQLPRIQTEKEPPWRWTLFTRILEQYFWHRGLKNPITLKFAHELLNREWHRLEKTCSADEMISILNQSRLLPDLLPAGAQVAAVHYPFRVPVNPGKRHYVTCDQSLALVVHNDKDLPMEIWKCPEHMPDKFIARLEAAYYVRAVREDLPRKTALLCNYNYQTGQVMRTQGSFEDYDVLHQIALLSAGKHHPPRPSKASCSSCDVSSVCPWKH